MSVNAAQSNPNNFNQTFFSASRRSVSNWIKSYFPIRLNSELYSLDNLEKRLSNAPINSSKVAGVFSSISSFVGWGAFAAQIGMSNVNVLDIEKSTSLSNGLNYALIGFPLSRLIGIKQNFTKLSLAKNARDLDSINNRISNIAINIFAAIGGIFFVMSKFTIESAASFGTAILSLPFYVISYLIDINKKSGQIQAVRGFKQEFKQFIKNDNDLNDARKLKQSLKFLLKQLQVTDIEKRSIESEVNLNEELKKNPKLRAERIQKKIDDLILIKYEKLENRIGKKAAKSFRKNVKDALNDLNRIFSKKEQAKKLVKEVQNGIFAEVRNGLIMLVIKVAVIAGLVAATALSGGTLTPIFTIL